MQDIKPLLVFAAVLEHGLMNAAAAALGMTPSAVSQHIARLEKLHQIKLFNRNTRRLTPTDAGRVLGAYCGRLKTMLADTQAAVSGLKTEASGELHLSLTSGIIDAPVFQTALQRLQSTYPDIRPVLHICDTLENLQTSHTDIAIRGGDNALGDPNLVSRHLATWHWQIYASPEYLAANPEPRSPDDLYRHRWLYFLPVRTTLHKGSQSCFIDIASGIPCDQIAAVRTLTAQGFGLSVQAAAEAAPLVAQGRLKAVLPDWTLPPVNLYLVTAYRVQSAKTEAAVRIFQESFAAERSA